MAVARPRRAEARAPVVFMGLLGLGSHNQEEARLVRRFVDHGHPLLYLRPLGVREPRPSEVAGRLLSIARPGPAGPPQADGVAAEDLRVLPGRWLGPTATLNRALVFRQLQARLRALDMERPVLWLRLPTPELVWQLDAFRPRAVVYECIDAYRFYPRYGPADRARLALAESRLVARADLVVCLSKVVAAGLGSQPERTHVVPLGVELERFTQPLPIPADLARLPRPRLGLVGGLDERVDADLLARLARSHPDWSLVLVGPAEAWRERSRLGALPNVHLLGRRPYEQVPAYLAGLDAGLIPYRHGGWADGSFPAKLFEYLAAGLPVVATNLPALRPFGEQVELAADADDFVLGVERALASDSRDAAAERRGLAARHTLGLRYQHLHDLLAALPVRPD